MLFLLRHLVHALMALATRCSNGFELDPGVDLFSEGTFIPKSSLSSSTVSGVVLFVVDVVVCTEVTGRGKTGKSMST